MVAMIPLYDEQRKVVEWTDGPLVITAGPGTGKTHTLVARLAKLIDTGVDPDEILGLTFTRKAARELRGRLEEVVGSDMLPMVSTFHALGYRLLEDAGEHRELIDENRRRQFVRELMRAHHLSELSVDEVLLMISRMKTRPGDQGNSEEISRLVGDYADALERLEKRDYDDLIADSLAFIRTGTIRKRYRYIHLDEFQDTSDSQYQLVKLLAGVDDNLCVIGDPLQSIYAFRGARSRIFDDFKRDFPHHRTVRLNRNFRSSDEVIKVGARLFPDEPAAAAQKNLSGDVSYVTTLNGRTEANWIVRAINRKLGGLDLNQASDLQGGQDDQAQFEDFAVVYRIHRLGRDLEKAFERSGLPFQVIGGDSIYQQPEIQLLSDCLFYLVESEESVKKEFWERIWASSATELSVERLGRILDARREQIARQGESNHLRGILDQFVDEIIPDKIKETVDNTTRINQFLSNLIRFDREPDPLRSAVSYLRYLEEHDYYDPDANRVTLMTMHAAKGLEFDYVFIAGFQEGLVPYHKQATQEELDEEKRLLYVAMTRAKKGLYLVRPRKRWGEQTEESRFFGLVKGEPLEEIWDPVIELVEKKIARKKDRGDQLELW